MTEEQMFNMSDEALEEAFLQAKADAESPVTDIEEEINDDVELEDEIEELDDVEEIEEDLEQPEEDSDDDLTIDDAEEAETDEDSKADTDELDEDIVDEEEQTEEVKEETEEEIEVQKHTFKANGKEYLFTQKEILEQFPKVFGQAMDYTKKTQAMKPWRKTIDAIEQAKLNHEDINLMIDVYKGDKDAIAEVIKRAGIDTLDIDTENSKYTPKDYGRDDTALAIKDVIEDISADKEYDITQRVLTNEWDERSVAEMTEDPELIRLLHIDVKSGMYDKVQPIAEKMKVFDRGRKTDLDYYKMASQEYFRDMEAESKRAEAIEQKRLDREAKEARQAEIERVKARQAKEAKTRERVRERKAAAPTRANAGTKKSTIDYLDDSDEAFEDWYEQNVTSKY